MADNWRFWIPKGVERMSYKGPLGQLICGEDIVIDFGTATGEEPEAFEPPSREDSARILAALNTYDLLKHRLQIAVDLWGNAPEGSERRTFADKALLVLDVARQLEKPERPEIQP